MNHSFPFPRFRGHGFFSYLATTTSVLAFATAAVALEPTPPRPTDAPPEVITNQAAPAPTRIIVKYIATEANRVRSAAAARTSASALSELVGFQLQHVRPMSGNAQVIEVMGLEGVQAQQVTETVADVAARIARNPAVEYAVPDEFNSIQQSSDPRIGEQWHYTKSGTGVNLPAGWSNAHGNGVVVAVIDTGFRPHIDLQGNLLPGFDFISNALVANDGNLRDADARDPGDWIASSDTWCPASPRNSSWHGTHVAGTVAAVTNNARGVAGVARGARVVPVRVLGKCGGLTSDIVDGMRWTAGLTVPGVPANANPAQVLNLSLGGSGSCSAVYQDAIDDIVAAGTTIVVAAGNSNSNAANFRPANCGGVITVASTNTDGARSYYSNTGSVVEIAAPGGETYADVADGVLSTLNAGTTVPAGDNYRFYQGTSMAAPHVAGVVALLYEVNPSITPAGAVARLQATAQPFPAVASNQCNTSNCGAGIVDAGEATKVVPPVQTTGWLRLLLRNKSYRSTAFRLLLTRRREQ